MPFGKYKGCEVHLVPESYLRWLESSGYIRTAELENEVKDALACADDGADMPPDRWDHS